MAHEEEQLEKKPKKKLITRRRVLQGTGGLVAATGLTAGGYILWGRHQRFSRDAQHAIRDHRVVWPANAPKMVIARGPDPARNVRGVLDKLGGMKQFITPQDVVLIKPNIGWRRAPKQAANTQPAIVAEVVRACRECRPKRVIVCDCPVSDSKAAFKWSGIGKAATAAGAEVLMPEESRFAMVKISERLGTWDVLEPFVQATKIINIPVAKHHGETAVTGGMKNWIGITNKLRFLFHNDINQSIAELAAMMLPTMTILDASRVLMRNGPQGGNASDVKQLNTVAACVDPVAIDAWGCSLLGTTPDKLPKYVTIAQKMGLGDADFARLSPVEITTG